MKKYLLKLAIFLSPFLIVIATYLLQDPFKVLYHYDKYFVPYGTIHIQLDKDFVSTQNFINKYDVFHYDSYIFGNSRSMYYPIEEWKKYVQGSSFYHFDASGENLIGIERKVQFLANRNVPIKNALFVIDAKVLMDTICAQNPVRAEHPALSGQNWLAFQQIFFKSFSDPNFLMSYYQLLLTKRFTPKMSKTLLNIEGGYYNDTTNEIFFNGLDAAIARNADSFYNARMDRFNTRIHDTDRAQMQNIDSGKLKMLTRIKNILVKDNTNYKFIISPGYNQLPMSKNDVKILKELFGENNVYDFTGVNDITSDFHSYFDETHYRPFVAVRLLDSVYHHMRK